jgi:hypothetical protein
VTVTAERGIRAGETSSFRSLGAPVALVLPLARIVL